MTDNTNKIRYLARACETLKDAAEDAARRDEWYTCADYLGAMVAMQSLALLLKEGAHCMAVERLNACIDETQAALSRCRQY